MRSLCSEFPCDNPSLHFGGTWVQLETTGQPSFEKNAEVPPVRVDSPVAPFASEASDPNAESTIEASTLEPESAFEPEPEPVSVRAPEALDPVLAASEEPTEKLVLESPIEAELVVARESDVGEGDVDLVCAEAEDLEPETAPEPRTSGIFLAAEAESGTQTTTEVAPAETVANDDASADDSVEVFCALLEEVATQFGGESAAEVVSSWLRDEDSPLAAERSPWLALLRGDECDLSSADASTLDEWASKMVSRASGRDAGEIRRELRNRGVAAYGLLAA